MVRHISFPPYIITNIGGRSLFDRPITSPPIPSPSLIKQTNELLSSDDPSHRHGIMGGANY